LPGHHTHDAEVVTMPALDDTAADLLFREAHTMDSFTGDPVPDERIAAAYELIRWAPTGGNASPGRFLLVRSPAARERLVAHMNQGNRAKTLAAPLTVVCAADTRYHELWPRIAPHRAEAAARLEGDPDARLRLATQSAWLQTAYFILGVRAVGLDAGPMGGFDRDGVDAEFFPDGVWRSLLIVNVGTGAPGGYRDRLPRLDFADVSRSV
jgi:3-hydroxypropanoate dehydrogenase